MRVFIDTNIYLKLFTPPGDQSEYLDKLVSLVKDGKITIVFSKIIQNEILRNINSFTSRYHKAIDETKVKKPEFKEIHDTATRTKIEKAFTLWTEAVEDLQRSYLTTIDKLTKKIFDEFREYTKDFDELEKLVQLAFHRKLKGYPPGKGNHIGDQLSWEILKRYCGDEDLAIISFDSDWDNNIKPSKKEIHPLIKEEWSEISTKNIVLYDSLGEFLKQFSVGREISKEDIEEEKEALPPFYGDQSNIGTILNYYDWRKKQWLSTVASNFGTAPIGGPSVGTPTVIAPGQGPNRSGWCFNCKVWFNMLPPICPSCGTTLS